MSLVKKYPKEIKQIMAKYPPEHKRSAVMPLLYLAQRDEGYVNKDALKDIAGMLDMTETEVASIVGFYTLYHDEKAGKYRMQVCTDLPCALRGADQFLESLCGNLGIKVGETTSDGLVTIEGVMCLAACDGIEYHENMTVDKTMELVAALKNAGREVK
jgi:NADH-quinone oxidoreductase subunit E